MATRRRALPSGWYPGDPAGVRETLDGWAREAAAERNGAGDGDGAVAAIAPHAGWYYSGAIAWRAWLAAAEADLAVVVGGHDPAGGPFLAAAEDAYDTPLGPVDAHAGLRAELVRKLGALPDTAVDNTVEVQLPMLAARFPGIPALWCRAPNDGRAAILGEALADYAKAFGLRLFVLGSTDLTHYGPNYGWEPAGGGKAGRDWARGADEAMAAAFSGLDGDAALRLANEDRAACSVGAALAAMAFARAMGAERGELLALGSSLEAGPADSFVGYCAVAYRP